MNRTKTWVKIPEKLEEFVKWLDSLREEDVGKVTKDISNWIKQNKSSANTAENIKSFDLNSQKHFHISAYIHSIPNLIP